MRQCSAEGTMEATLTANNNAIIQRLKQIESLNKSCDVQIRNGIKQIAFAHKMILGAISPLLCELMQEIPRGETATLILPEIEKDTVTLLIAFIYNGKLVCGQQECNQLMELMQLLCLESVNMSSETYQRPTGPFVEDEFANLNFCVPRKRVKKKWPAENNADPVAPSVEPTVWPEAQNLQPGSLDDYLDNDMGYLDAAETDPDDIPIHQSNGDDFKDETNAPTFRGESFLCKVCNKGFSSAQFLDSHQRFSHPKNVGKFKCDQCDYATNQSSSFKTHLVTHSEVKRFVCEYCGKPFSSHGALSYHHKVFHKEDSAKLKCDVCSKPFAHRANLKVHQRIHTGERPYLCNQCGKTFVTLSTLNAHKRSHTGERPYTCRFCDMKFVHVCERNRHERTHTGEQPYQCTHCDRRFSSMTQLKRHTRIHTGEKPFECQHCSKRFAQRSNMKTHLRTHTGELPYECKYCKSQFKHSMSLRSHIVAMHREFLNF